MPARPQVRPPVMAEPAAMYEPSAMATGATSVLLLPTKTPSPMMVWCFFSPS